MGLIISFVDESIPPMLIVSPILITSNLILAALKKEFKQFWNGEKIKEYKISFGTGATVAF